MVETALPLSIVTAAFLSVAVLRFAAVLRPVLAGASCSRLDRPWDRFRGVLTDVGLHRRLLRLRYSGILHLLLFFGFLVLLSAIVESFGRGFVAGFSLDAVGGGTWIALLQDVFAVLIVVAVGMAAYQRIVVRPARFVGSNAGDAWFIYGSVLLVVVTMLMENASRQIAGEAVSSWRPATAAIAAVLTAAGLPASAAVPMVTGFYWAHVIAVLGFLAYIPGSKHRHIFTAAPNIYFRTLDRSRELSRPEPATPPPVGAGAVDRLDWKHRLDLISCTECGRCQAACPAYAAGLPLSPKLLITDLRDHMLGGGGEPAAGSFIAPETLWACTACRACVDACPVRIEPMVKIVELRRPLVEAGQVEPMLQASLTNLGRSGNSQGKSRRQRARWTKDLGFDVKDARVEAVDLLWYVGDFASFDPRVQPNTRLVAELFRKAGVDFGLLFEDEQNAGNDVRRAGEEALFESLAQSNVEALAKARFKRIVTTDPHTFNALKNDYRAFGFEGEVVHYTTVILELLDAGRLALPSGAGEAVTYHDPCFLGRYNGGFDAPREIIRRAGYRLHEMPRSRENSFCCGAGGGRIWMDDSAATERPSESRIKEALALGDVRWFVVSCPKDTVMYSAAAQSLGAGEKLKVCDIVELLAGAEPG